MNGLGMAVAALLVLAASGCGGKVCEGSCACDGTVCSCDGTAACTVACDRPECDVTCATSGDCGITIGAGASVSCDGPGLCDVTCEGDCTVGCTGGGQCRVECMGQASCALQSCPSAIVTCGSVQVCGGPCTG
jgi:hypothetical protein